jgi:hypothetical protein
MLICLRLCYFGSYRVSFVLLIGYSGALVLYWVCCVQIAVTVFILVSLILFLGRQDRLLVAWAWVKARKGACPWFFSLYGFTFIVCWLCGIKSVFFLSTFLASVLIFTTAQTFFVDFNLFVSWFNSTLYGWLAVTVTTFLALNAFLYFRGTCEETTNLLFFLSVVGFLRVIPPCRLKELLLVAQPFCPARVLVIINILVPFFFYWAYPLLNWAPALGCLEQLGRLNLPFAFIWVELSLSLICLCCI